jgi:hypothetical protein
MRTTRRTIAMVIAALTLSVMLATLAGAAERIITYKGNTSAATPTIRLKVLKRDDGRRFLTRLRVRHTLTCDDASSFESIIAIWFGGIRLGEAGEFSWQFPPAGQDEPWTSFFAVEGAISFRNASGTVTEVQAVLTDDHTDSQVCTTGDLAWTAERTASRPARPPAARTTDGTRVTKIRVSGGVAESWW